MLHSSEGADIAWFRPDGQEMTEEDWGSGYAKSLAVFLNGDAIPTPDRRGEPVIDDSFLLAFNAHHERIDFVLPPETVGKGWLTVIDTAEPEDPGERFGARAVATLAGRSLRVLRRT